MTEIEPTIKVIKLGGSSLSSAPASVPEAAHADLGLPQLPEDKASDEEVNGLKDAPHVDEVSTLKPERQASKLALIAKKEKALFEKTNAYKQQQAKIEAYENSLKAAKANPLKYLESAGLSMDDLVKAVLSEGEPPTKEDQHEIALKTVNEKLAEIERRDQERHEQAIQAQNNQTVSEIKSVIKKTISEKSEAYEAINTYGREDDVFDLMFQSYSELGTKLTIEQAAQLVEDQLQEDAQEQAERIAKLKRFAKDKSSEPKQEESIPKQQDPTIKKETNQPFKTLTNKNATVYPSASKPLLSKEESLRQAAKLIKWRE